MINYVDHFNIFGVDVKQRPTLTGNGEPTNSTAAVVGELYMDVDTGILYKCILDDGGVYIWDEVCEKAVLYTKQELTAEQKKQARDNIDALGRSTVERETLPFTYTQSYANATTFAYTKRDTPGTYWMFECGTVKGGVLSVSWDTTRLSQFDLIIYLFDRDGKPYGYSQYSGPNPNTTPFAGENITVNWSSPGTGSGFCKATAPFTVEIPDGCSVMICMRNTNMVAVEGSGLTASELTANAQQFFDVVVEKVTVDDELYNTLIATGLFDAIINIDESVKNYDATVKSVNHRGYNKIAPENTISAFKLSKAHGFIYVETDVSFTSDNVPVLLHDDTIDRTSNGTGSVGSMTFEQLRSYDFGSWKSEEYAGEKIPSFEEFIVFCKKAGLHPYIELKTGFTEARAEILVNIVKRYAMIDKVTWIAFSAAMLQYIKNLIPTARLGYLLTSISDTNITTINGLKNDANEVFIDVNVINLTVDMVNMCIEANIPLEVWGITNVGHILNANGYISGMTTDDIIAGKVLQESVL